MKGDRLTAFADSRFTFLPNRLRIKSMALPSHHAFVAYAAPRKVKEFAAYIAGEVGIHAAGNPDFHIREFESLDVDDARAISSMSLMKSTGGKKVFVIAAHTITRQAQNALLKTLEEPSEHTQFAFLVPRGALIDTVKSRVIEIHWRGKESDDSLAREFVKSTPDKRTALIAGLLKDKDREGARELLDGIERTLLGDLKDRGVRKAVEELAVMRNYLQDASSSLKMLLEHFSLVLPKR